MIRLVNRGTGDVLGTIQEADFEVMRKALEEEGEEDRDYYVVEQTLETLAEQGLSSDAQSMLRNAFSKDGDLECCWERIVDHPTHEIEGSLLWASSKLPAVGMQVEVRERRGILRGDALLAWAFSRTDGTFEIDCTDEVESDAAIHVCVVDKVRGVLLQLPLQKPLARYIKVGEQQLPEMFVSE